MVGEASQALAAIERDSIASYTLDTLVAILALAESTYLECFR